MNELTRYFRAGAIYDENGRSCSDTMTLKLGKDAPSRFPNMLALPFFFPISNRADSSIFRTEYDCEHQVFACSAALTITLVALKDLLWGFGPSEVFGHDRVAHQLFEKG